MSDQVFVTIRARYSNGARPNELYRQLPGGDRLDAIMNELCTQEDVDSKVLNDQETFLQYSLTKLCDELDTSQNSQGSASGTPQSLWLHAVDRRPPLMIQCT